MSHEKSFEIGETINTHGLNGYLKIYPTTDKISRFSLLEKICIDGLEYEIENVRYHKNFVYLKLVDVNDISSAEKLKNKTIRISDDLALPLDKDEYYIRDLYGMKVYEKKEFLGYITDVIQTGANDVYVVDDKLLIPAIKKCIINVNTESKVMEVDLEQIKGLRDLNA